MMIPEVDKSDLSTYFLSYGDVDSVKKEVKYSNRWLYENEVYGIPITVVGRGVLYNKKVFKEAGITELPVLYLAFSNLCRIICTTRLAISLVSIS